ncbi:MAG TPA: hypothetical protein VER36_10725, partial [Flavisolibacter sp.]|nr:hypothetical protein [Flavisolibacter sp.]
VSEVGDMPVWVEEGHNGWVGRSASVEEIDTALERAWQQKGQWPQAGKKSFTLFKEKFPVSAESRFLQQLFQVIRSIDECANPPSYQ